MEYQNLKHLSEEQIQILKSNCTGGTLETMDTIEAGFASWGHAKFLSDEVVFLALQLESRNQATSKLHEEIRDLLQRLESKNEEIVRLWNRI